MEITHEVYYIEWLDTPMPEGVTVVEDINSPAGADGTLARMRQHSRLIFWSCILGSALAWYALYVYMAS